MIIKPFIMSILVMHNANSMDGDSHLYPEITSLALTMTKSQCDGLVYDMAYSLIQRGTPPIIIKCEKVESFYHVE